MKKIRNLAIILAFLIFATIVLPHNVFAAEGMDKYLTNGKLVIPSIPPQNEEEAYAITEYLSDETDGEYYVEGSTFNSTYTKATISDGNTSKEVEIVYEYDKDVKKVFDGMVSKIPEDKAFIMSDMELVNYWLYGSDEDVFNYSSEVKEATNYKNFNFNFTVGLGGDLPSALAQTFGGMLKSDYNGTVYYVKPYTELKQQYVIYVDDNTSDDKILDTIKNRVNTLFGNGKVTITEKGSLNNWYPEYFGEEYDDLKQYDTTIASMTKQEYIESKILEIDDVDNDLHFLKNAYEKYFSATIGEVEHYFVVIKDSSKIQKAQYKTSDVGTDITISSKSVELPLDTLIKASKLTSGDEYDKIIKTLEVTNSETYDLTLYSNSLDRNITKLDNGKFEVKIPVPDTLKDKTLIVYYVGADNKVEEHEVTVKDGYATFTTDHFSIYTLAEKKVVDETPNNTPTNTTGEKDETPKTGTVDIIGYVLVATIISALGIVVLNKKETK